VTRKLNDGFELVAELARCARASQRQYGYATGKADQPSREASWWMVSSLRFAARALRLADQARARQDEPDVARALTMYGITL
jgi:hypothetical protein